MNLDSWLDKKEFDSLLSSNQVQVIVFATKWCGYCTSFISRIRNYSMESDPNLFVVNVDSSGGSLWDEYRISLVPTLAVFKAGLEVFRRDGRPGVGLLLDDFIQGINIASNASRLS